jgi:hypothetical protein
MEAIKKTIARSKIAYLFDIPESYGEKVKVIILPEDTPENETSHNNSIEMMRLQENSGFVQTVLGDEAEDVWNEV